MAIGTSNHEPDAVAGASSALPDDDAELVELARTRPEAFGRLYDRHYGRVLNYLYRRTLNVALAEELTSNTFFNALRALPGYVHRGKFGAWLYRIAGNEIRLHWRYERNQRDGASRWRQDPGRVRFAPDETLAAEDAEEKMRQFTRLHDALSRLPERYQTVLALRYFEGMSYDEVADVLGKRIGTVKSLLHRGLVRLKRQFEGNRATCLSNLHYQREEG